MKEVPAVQLVICLMLSVLSLSTNAAVIEHPTGAYGYVPAGGSYTLASTDSIIEYDGFRTDNYGTITLEAGSTVTSYSGSSYYGHDGSSVDIYGAVSHDEGHISVLYSGGKYTGYDGSILNNNADVTNYGSIDIQEGATVNGTGSYTQEQGGRIIVNGELTQDSIYIEGAGYLGGSGTINGDVYASGSDVIINSGNSPGTLTINGNLTVEDGAKIILEIGASGHDTLQVSGDFNLAADIDIVFDFLDGYDETILELFELTDFFEATTEEANQPTPELDLSLFSTVNFSYQSDSNEMIALNLGNNGQISQVPEPSTLALLILGLSGLAFQRKRST